MYPNPSNSLLIGRPGGNRISCDLAGLSIGTVCVTQIFSPIREIASLVFSFVSGTPSTTPRERTLRGHRSLQLGFHLSEPIPARCRAGNARKREVSAMTDGPSEMYFKIRILQIVFE